MDRRAFLRALGFGTVAAAAAATGGLDIEKLLWVPREKAIFLPAPLAPLGEKLWAGDFFTITGQYAMNPNTCEELPFLQHFVAIATVSQGSELKAANLYPTIRTDGPYKNAVSSMVRNGLIDGHSVSRGRLF